MGDMLVSIWSILANFGMDTGDIANKIGSIIAVDEKGDYTGTLAPLAEVPLVGSIILLFADIGNSAGQSGPTTIA
ncbi:MAG: hypothetical protein IKC01_03370 [Clostridia bacterium]|nr:hypothetical protein [Clostridia bacterium]